MRRRDIVKFAGVAAFPAFAVDAALSSGTLDESKAKLTRESFGELRIYYTGPTEQLSSMTAGSLHLKAGMSPHPPHQHPEEEFMVITEGTGEIRVEGQTIKVGRGSMMYCAGNRMHGIVNTGQAPLLFYFYKWQK
jgi:quercetin dioxygenase-like cupin family protein